MTDKVIGSDEFFGLVDEFLSPRMAELGYHRIGGFENDQPQSRGMLTRSATPSRAVGRRARQDALLAALRTLLRRWAPADSAGSAPFLLYDFGFEAGSDDVRQLVNPEDPETADELWLSYEPATGELDLRAWDSIAEGVWTGIPAPTPVPAAGRRYNAAWRTSGGLLRPSPGLRAVPHRRFDMPRCARVGCPARRAEDSAHASIAPMTEVYLHVGPVKTGSTYLQDLLWRNREDLGRQGYQHPGEHDNEMWLAINDVQDQAFIHFEMPEAAGVWAKLCERVLSFAGPSVISHEVLGMSTEDHIAKIVHSLAPARVHVVVMARSLAPMLPSLWQEKVKMVDPDISWPDFLVSARETGAPLTDASLIVQRWLAHVPPEQIHVVTVPFGGEPRLLLDRFADALGVDTSAWTTDGDAANRSLDRVQVELLRRLNLATSASLDRRAQRRLIQGALLPTMRTADPQRRIRLLASERGWIEAETSRRIEALRNSGATVHGDLTDLEVPADAVEDVPPHVSVEDLLEEALQLLASSHPDLHPDRLDIV